MIGVARLPPRHWGWKQYRALGSVALGLCDVATGGLDAWVELATAVAPWDYLGGLLVVQEAGACVVDAEDRELVTTDPDARRQLLAAVTPELLAEIRVGGAGVSTLDLDALLDAGIAAAHAGGAIVREAFGTARNVVAKAPGDWVSDTDTASERVVRAALLAAAPDIPVLGEEEGGERAALGWLVDPLDGTANFLHGFPVVGGVVALVEDGVPVIGVVDAPLLGDTFTGRRGGGAWRGSERLSVSDRSVERARSSRRVSRSGRSASASTSTSRCSSARSAPSRTSAVPAPRRSTWRGRRAGVFDGYFEQALGPWDVAAGALLVREAGGVVTDWSGRPRRVARLG